jgi:hypothetical protein
MMVTMATDTILTGNYRWSLGILIGLPLSILIVVILIGIGIAMFFADELGGSFLCMFCAVLVIAATACLMWPYAGEYHQWRETRGTVEVIDSRLVGANKSTTERFVVTFTDGRQRSCDDTRCSAVREGDELTLMCKRAWQWAGEHGYDCNFVSVKAVR